MLVSTSGLEKWSNLCSWMILFCPLPNVNFSRTYDLSNFTSITVLIRAFSLDTGLQYAFCQSPLLCNPRVFHRICWCCRTHEHSHCQPSPSHNTNITWQWLRLNDNKGSVAVLAIEEWPQQLLVKQLSLMADLSMTVSYSEVTW